MDFSDALSISAVIILIWTLIVAEIFLIGWDLISPQIDIRRNILTSIDYVLETFVFKVIECIIILLKTCYYYFSEFAIPFLFCEIVEDDGEDERMTETVEDVDVERSHSEDSGLDEGNSSAGLNAESYFSGGNGDASTARSDVSSKRRCVHSNSEDMIVRTLRNRTVYGRPLYPVCESDVRNSGDNLESMARTEKPPYPDYLHTSRTGRNRNAYGNSSHHLHSPKAETVLRYGRPRSMLKSQSIRHLGYCARVEAEVNHFALT